MNTKTFYLDLKYDEKVEELISRIEAYVANEFKAKIRKEEPNLKLTLDGMRLRSIPENFDFTVLKWLVEVELEV